MTAGRAPASRPLVAGFVLLVANSAFLAASASPTLFFYSNVALQVALGVVVTLGARRGVLGGQPAPVERCRVERRRRRR